MRRCRRRTVYRTRRQTPEHVPKEPYHSHDQPDQEEAAEAAEQTAHEAEDREEAGAPTSWPTWAIRGGRQVNTRIQSRIQS